jgi:membrane-associated phospholipid phosphatase
MCASTVWGRYHYVADIFAGILTGTLGYVLGSKLMRLSPHSQPSPESRCGTTERSPARFAVVANRAG